MKSLRHIVPTLAALVLALVLSGCGKDSTPTSANPVDETPPAAPTQVGLSMDPGTGRPYLDWAPSTSPSVIGYEVYNYAPHPDRDNAYTLAGETDGSTTIYPLPSVSEPTSLYYRVKAVAANGTRSGWSTIALIHLRPWGGSPDGNPEPHTPGVELDQ